jgi:hypothetical protein
VRQTPAVGWWKLKFTFSFVFKNSNNENQTWDPQIGQIDQTKK